MKLRALAPVLSLLLASIGAVAADANRPSKSTESGMDAPAAVWATGMVMDIDKRAAKVTLIHGPINNVGLGPLTMEFPVKDVTGLAKIKDGDRVRFQAERIDGKIVIVVIEIEQ